MAAGSLIKFSIDGAPQTQELGAAMQGRLGAFAKTREATLAKASSAAMDSVTKHGVSDLRADIASGGFARQTLVKTWHGQRRPSGAPVMDPAAWFWNKAGPIIDAFANGITITVKDASFLAIPEGPAKGIIKTLNTASLRSREGGKFAKEDNPVDRVAAALGVKLVAIIDQASGHGVLVAANPVRLTAKTGRVAKRQTGENTVLFALVRQATLKKRIKGRAVLDEIKARFPSEYAGQLVAGLSDGSSASA